jgi:hypothetical protein
MSVKLFFVAVTSFLFFLSCKKSTSEKINVPHPPQPVAKLKTLTVGAPSGATLYYDFQYDSSQLKTISERSNVSYLGRFKFNYTDGKITFINFLSVQNNPEGELFDSLTFTYSGDQLVRSDRYVVSSGIIYYDGYVVYSYTDDGKLKEKTGYIGVGTQPPALACRSRFVYDINGDITGMTWDNLQTGAAVSQISFSIDHGSIENDLFKNNIGLAGYWWFIINPNEFYDGYIDAFFNSRHFPTEATRDIDAAKKIYKYIYNSGPQGISSFGEFDNVFDNGSNSMQFSYMNFTYVLL